MIHREMKVVFSADESSLGRGARRQTQREFCTFAHYSHRNGNAQKKKNPNNNRLNKREREMEGKRNRAVNIRPKCRGNFNS